VNAFDELERRLFDSVAARARSRRSVAAAGLGRWWRGRHGSAAVALAACAASLVLLLAALTPSDRGRPDARHTAFAALIAPGAQEAACPPCRSVGGRLHAPLTGETGRAATVAVREVVVRRGLPAVVWGVEPRRLR